MTENEAIEWLRKIQNPMISEAELYCAETCYGLGKMVYPEPEDYVFETAIQALEEIQQYRAIGTVEEVQEAKMQYDDIHSVAEKTALIGLSDYGTAKEAVITEMKRNLDYSLKEYQSIGTIEEFKALKYKSVAKKPIRQPNHDMTYEEVLCPRCKRYVSKYTNPYCECGQKLDWE